MRFLAVIEIPTLHHKADRFMLRQIRKTEDLVAFLIGAFDVKIEIHFLKCLAKDGFDVVDGCSTAIGTFIIILFGCPSSDAGFAEEFAACVALVGVEDNLYADGALKGLMSCSYESIWVIASDVHFVDLVIIL